MISLQVKFSLRCKIIILNHNLTLKQGIDYVPSETEQAESKELTNRSGDFVPIYRDDDGGLMSTPEQRLLRNERAMANLIPSGSTGATKSQRPYYKDASLALRALNANRYLKHLSSGQPLIPYEAFMVGPGDTKTQQQ